MALEIFIPNTGQGDCTFIAFPNGKNMLMDINRTDVDVDIIELLKKKIPKKKHEDIGKTCRRINYLVNTHPHEDHIKGIGDLDTDEFYIDELWESGHRLYVPADQKDQYKHYYDFLALVKKLKKRNAVKKIGAARAPRTYIGSTTVYAFAPSKYVVDSESREDIHNQCAILRIEYTGNSILFAGDSNKESWENRIVPYYSDDKMEDGKKQKNLLKSTVLHAAHHGSKDFFVKSDDDNKYKRAIEKIHPSFTIISVGSNNKHGHPHRIAMNIYREKTKRKRVWTTKDNKSMYFAFKNDGKVEYKKDLDYDDLAIIKHEIEDSEAAIKSTAATLSFEIGEEIEMELPNRPPKPKREGYR